MRSDSALLPGPMMGKLSERGTSPFEVSSLARCAARRRNPRADGTVPRCRSAGECRTEAPLACYVRRARLKLRLQATLDFCV